MLNAGLEEIRQAWDKTDGEGRDEALARSLSDQYVADNPALFDGWEATDEDDLIQALETFRNAGMENEEWKVQAWLFHRFKPRNIGGVYQSEIRTVGSE